jgi:bifunctional DNA-binding transcriptional regulator/antitoxin component of YhaV-PrlF toxin-antitoxin module
MTALDHQTETDESIETGFSTVDNKGRIALTKAARHKMGIQPGSSVAYITLDHALLLIPQDEYLSSLLRHAAEALSSSGLSVQDLVDALPQARDETLAEAYSAEFLREMERLWATSHAEAETE